MDARRPRCCRGDAAPLHARRAEAIIRIRWLRAAPRHLCERLALLGGGAAPLMVAPARFRRIGCEAGITTDEPHLWRRAQCRVKAGAPHGFSLRTFSHRSGAETGLIRGTFNDTDQALYCSSLTFSIHSTTLPLSAS